MMRIFIFILFTQILLSSVEAQSRFYIYEKSGEYNAATWIRYNRADGLFTGLTGQFFFNDDFWISARAGYGFSSKKPRYKIELDKVFPSNENDYYIKADYYRLTHTNDAGIIPDWQNSLTAAVARLDYYNHMDLHGGTAVFGVNWRGVFKTEITSGVNRYASLKTKTQKSLFRWGGERIGGKRIFGPNPSVEPGYDVFAGFRLDYDPRPSPSAFINAWLVRTEYENSKVLHGLTGSDFNYQRLSLHIQRHQRIMTRPKLMFALSLRSFEGRSSFMSDEPGVRLPSEQFLNDLGGLGTLRGYRYREFQNANRMMSGKIDFLFNGSFLPRTPFAKWWGIGWLFRKFDIVFFADGGQAWLTGDQTFLLDPKGLKLRNMAYDAGAGLSMGPWLRFDAAFPLKKTRLTKSFQPVYYFTFSINI